ncbi:hypothetical protein C8R47DRAFT_1320773 [Mycena vitilis]|nr:hypothetical protein C8R47DRAFT_1320773 [Mycena vitilis]
MVQAESLAVALRDPAIVCAYVGIPASVRCERAILVRAGRCPGLTRLGRGADDVDRRTAPADTTTLRRCNPAAYSGRVCGIETATCEIVSSFGKLPLRAPLHPFSLLPFPLRPLPFHPPPSPFPIPSIVPLSTRTGMGIAEDGMPHAHKGRGAWRASPASGRGLAQVPGAACTPPPAPVADHRRRVRVARRAACGSGDTLPPSRADVYTWCGPTERTRAVDRWRPQCPRSARAPSTASDHSVMQVLSDCTPSSTSLRAPGATRVRTRVASRESPAWRYPDGLASMADCWAAREATGAGAGAGRTAGYAAATMHGASGNAGWGARRLGRGRNAGPGIMRRVVWRYTEGLKAEGDVRW